LASGFRWSAIGHWPKARFFQATYYCLMKAQKIFMLKTTALVILAIGATALSKLTRNAEAIAALTKTGVGPYITLLFQLSVSAEPRR
jgi:hypothetical protein